MTHNEFIAERPQASSADNQLANNATPHFDASSLLDEGLHQKKLFAEGAITELIYPVNGIVKGITGHDAYDFPNQKEVDSSTAGKLGQDFVQAGALIASVAAGAGAFVIPYEIGLYGGAGAALTASLLLGGITGATLYGAGGEHYNQPESD